MLNLYFIVIFTYITSCITDDILYNSLGISGICSEYTNMSNFNILMNVTEYQSIKLYTGECSMNIFGNYILISKYMAEKFILENIMIRNNKKYKPHKSQLNKYIEIGRNNSIKCGGCSSKYDINISLISIVCVFLFMFIIILITVIIPISLRKWYESYNSYMSSMEYTKIKDDIVYDL